ncbi:MAG: ABC transporter permease, partial [Bauldia litoralis]
MSRFIRRNGWVFGLFVLFGLLLVFTRAIQPDYGSAAFISLTLAVLPFAFAAAAQTPVVIAGGIDLSIASMMALTSVTAATLMDGA